MKTEEHKECCHEPRGLVWYACDNCGGIVQPDHTGKSLEQFRKEINDIRKQACKLIEEGTTL